MSNNSDNKWNQPLNPPPSLFFNQKEKNFVKQVNDEIVERIIGQEILYYPISLEHTNFHPLYGESNNKTFLPPIKVGVLIDWEDQETNYETYGADKITRIIIHFHHRRLSEDQNLFVREGDYILYGDKYYEITQLMEPRLLFGNVNDVFEISANAINVRKNIFDGR